MNLHRCECSAQGCAVSAYWCIKHCRLLHALYENCTGIAIDGSVANVTAEEAATSLAPLLPSRFSGQEINENGLNGVHKSAFEPVTSCQNKRRKLNPHASSESDNNSQPTAGEPVVMQQGDQRQ